MRRTSVLIIILFVLGCAAGQGPQSAPPPAPNLIWSMEGGGPGRTYRTTVTVSPDWRTDKTVRLQPLDKFAPEERSGPLIINGVAYVGHSGRRFEAVNLATEEILWSVPVSGRIYTTAAYADGLLVFGDDHGTVTAVDLAGTVVWTFSAGYPVVASPLIADGKVFVAVADQNVFCLELNSGEPVWQYGRQLPRRQGIWRALGLCYGDNRVFAGFADGSLVALDAVLGRVLWRKELGSRKLLGDVSVGPTYAGGKVFAGAFSGPVVCLQAATGEEVWRAEVEGTAGFAVGDRVVYLGTNAGEIMALGRADGAVLWKVALDGGVPAPPVLAGDAVVTGASAGSFYVLSAEDGAVRQSFRPGTGVYAQAAVTPRGILFFSNGGVLHWVHGGQLWD